MAIKCPKCHSENPETKRFCGECGTKLDTRIRGHVPDSPESGTCPQNSGLKDQASVTKTLETNPDELVRGTLFAGRYEIIEELGTGGMGRVYRAYDKKIEEEVALKLIRPDVAAEKRTVERFRNEIKTARKIRHANVCGMHDLHEEGKTLFITMEYVRGEDLKSLMKRTKVLAAGTAVSIARQIAEGLGEAHRLGVVHRDLKPGNIMIDKEGNAKIMDFGIARSLAGAGTTAEGAIIGTPEYMSPEQVEGRPADERADIYALGVILFEMVTGHPPFEAETSLAIAHKHRYEPAPDPRMLNPQIPQDLSHLILRCLEKERDVRYQTSGEFLADLEAVQASIPKSERAPGRVPTRMKPKTSREITVKISPRKLLIPALALIAIVAIGIGLMKFLPNRRSAQLDSIAVLPFRYLSSDKEKEYWAEAMTVALNGKLAQVSGLKKVTSPQSTMQYKGSTKKASDIARELGVAALVTGNIFQVGDRIRISVQLIDAKNDRNLWSDDYDYNTEDILILQSNVTKSIVGEIRIKLTPQEEMRLAKTKAVNKVTYDALIKTEFAPPSQYSMEETFRISEEKFKEIIREDPDFAQPYVALALNYMNQASLLYSRPYDGYLKAKEAAEKALKLDDSIGMAHAILWPIRAITDHDWAGAMREMEVARALSPNDSMVFIMDCFLHNCQGLFDEAIASANRAIELDPLQPSTKFPLALTYYCSRRYNEALEVFNEIVKAMPDHSFFSLYVLRCYVAKDMRREALVQAAKIMTLPEANQDAQILGTVGFAYGILGEKTQAETCLNMMTQVAQKKYADPQHFARIYVGLGDAAYALEWLEKAVEERSDLSEIKTDPLWDPIRREPRFQEILKKIGLG